jgi:hypothetical protein
MLLTKLKVAVGAVMVMVALGAGGLVFRASAQLPPAVVERKPDSKPRSELETLRHENELLKLNLEVVLEKVRAQEAELRNLRGQVKAASVRIPLVIGLAEGKVIADVTLPATRPDPMHEAEAALKALREAPDQESRRRAADQLEKALKKVREQMKKQEAPPPGK